MSTYSDFVEGRLTSEQFARKIMTTRFEAVACDEPECDHHIIFYNEDDEPICEFRMTSKGGACFKATTEEVFQRRQQ